MHNGPEHRIWPLGLSGATIDHAAPQQNLENEGAAEPPVQSLSEKLPSEETHG
jgi:hypothetical protein